MTRENTNQPGFDLRRLTYKLRPPRNAILVPPDMAWDDFDSIIQKLSWYWGGPLSLLIPCNGSEIEPPFWEHLRFYDPDYLYSLLEVEALHPDLLTRLSMRLGPFESYSHGGVGPCHYGWHRLHSIELPVVYTDMQGIDGPLVIWDLQSLPAYLQVFFHEHTGHLSKRQIEDLRNPDDVRWRLGADPDLVKVAVEERELDAGAPFSLLSFVRRGSELTPRRMATWALGHIAYDCSGTRLHEGRPPEAPALVIVGDTVDDYCMAHNLRILTHEAHWLPRLPQEAMSGDVALLGLILDDLVDRLLYPPSQYKCERVLVYSTSKSNDQLQASRDEIASRIAGRQERMFRGEPEVGNQAASPPSEDTPVAVAENSSELLTYHLDSASVPLDRGSGDRRISPTPALRFGRGASTRTLAFAD